VFSVTLSVNARFREYCPRILRGMLPYGVRTFLQQILPTRDSPAIICHREEIYHKQESRKARAMEARVETFHDFLISYFKTAMER
jgi:hypothetical protein